MVQEQAELQFDVLVEQMAEREGVTEQLKEENQMLWAQKMNNIRARSEEIVREEIIYPHLVVDRCVLVKESDYQR